MSENRKILYVYSGKMKGAGIDLVVHHQVKALADQGCAIDFLSRGRFNHKNVRNLCLPYTPANLISFAPSAHYYSAQKRFFSLCGAFLISSFSYDIIISWARQSLSLFRKAKKFGKSCILNEAACHYNYPLGASTWIDRVWPCFKKKDYEEEYLLADAIMVASDVAVKSFLENRYPGNKIYDIGRGTDISRFFPDEHKEEEIFRVAFLGKVAERKGVFHLFEAWEKADLKQAELWIIGFISNKMKESLLKKLPGNVKFWGFIQNPENLLQKCHVQVLLSRSEGMAKSLIEGAACGLVTITTVQSGFPVQEGETGFFVEREDSKKISELLRYLQSKSSLRESMSKKSRQYVEKNLSWDIFRKRFLAVVKNTYPSVI